MRRENAAACLLLAVATLLIFRDWLFDGRALFWGDMGQYFVPMERFLRAQVVQGMLPLWNPQIFGGVPFAGNPQAWPLYPVTALLTMLPAVPFLMVSSVLHIFLAGVFAFFWLRVGRTSLPLWPALLGAAAWMFGGYLVTKAQYPNMLQALAYVPLVLWGTETLVTRPSLAAGVGLGTALGLQLLAAHAQVTLYTLYLAIAYGLFCLAACRGQRIAGICAGALTAGGLALALGGGEWLPTLAAQRLANRQALTLADVDRLHLPISELSNLVMPWRFGVPLRGDYTGAGAFWETACYTGTLTVTLALLFVVTRLPCAAPHRGEALFWLAVLVGSVWLALGTGGGLFRAAHAVVPGFRFFHDPARLLLGAAVALPVLAGRGLEWLLRFTERFPTAAFRPLVGIAAAGLTVLDLGHFDADIYPLLPVRQWETLAVRSPVMAFLHADPTIAGGTGRLLSADDINAGDAFLDWTDFRPPPGFLARETNTGLPNLPLAADVRLAGGYEPLVLRDTGVLALLARQAVQAQGGDRMVPGSTGKVAPLLGFMAVQDLITFRPQPLRPMPGLMPALSWRDGIDRGTVLRNARFVSRARLYASWTPTTGTVAPETVVGSLFAPATSADMLDRPWIEGAPAPPTTAAVPPVSLGIVRDAADQVSLAVPARPSPTACLLADTDFPGWLAFLDGRPVPIHRADGVYRTVFLPGDSRPHRVEFRFRPESFVVGLYLSGLGVLFLAAFSTASFVRRKLT